MSFRLSRAADKDLSDIWDYVARDSVQNADRVESELHSAMQLLASFPGMGHQRSDVDDPRYRFWNVYNFVIAYRMRGRTLTVVRVIHGSRDFRKLFH